jgi:transcriptional regulator with XRE-family HTH domain
MARHPKPENKNNPLKQLRNVLGGISQREFAKLLPMSPETVRSVEARDDYGMSKATREKLAIHLGAAWDEDKECWVFPFTGEPYSREHYEAWKKPSYDRELEIHAICLQVLVLLQSVSNRDFTIVADYLQATVSQTRKTFKIRVTDKDFERASVRAGIPLNKRGSPLNGDQPLASYRWERPSLYRDGDPHQDEQGFMKYDPAHPEWFTKVKLFDFREKLPK